MTTFDIINAILNKDDDKLFKLPLDTPYWLLHNVLNYSINTLNLELFNNLIAKGAKFGDNEIAPTIKLLIEKGNEEWLNTFVSLSLVLIPKCESQLVEVVVTAAIKYKRLNVLKNWYPKLLETNVNTSEENAVKNEDIEIIKCLIPNLPYFYLVDGSLKNSSPEIVEFLIDNVLQQKTIYEEQEFYYIIKMAIDKNLNITPIVNTLEKYGLVLNKTVLTRYLFSSISNKCLSNIEYLIAKGADVNVQTPITYAIDSGCLDIVKCLLSHGAKVTKHVFLTALYNYMDTMTDEHKQIVKLLLDNINEELLTNTNDYWNKNLRL